MPRPDTPRVRLVSEGGSEGEGLQWLTKLKRPEETRRTGRGDGGGMAGRGGRGGPREVQPRGPVGLADHAEGRPREDNEGRHQRAGHGGPDVQVQGRQEPLPGGPQEEVPFRRGLNAAEVFKTKERSGWQMK